MPAATAGASQAGSAVAIPLPTIHAIRAEVAIVAEEAIAGEAVMAAGEAIRAAKPQTNGYIPIRHEPIFRFILVSVRHHFGITRKGGFSFCFLPGS
jgi:hypothetical protein